MNSLGSDCILFLACTRSAWIGTCSASSFHVDRCHWTLCCNYLGCECTTAHPQNMDVVAASFRHSRGHTRNWRHISLPRHNGYCASLAGTTYRRSDLVSHPAGNRIKLLDAPETGGRNRFNYVSTVAFICIWRHVRHVSHQYLAVGIAFELVSPDTTSGLTSGSTRRVPRYGCGIPCHLWAHAG